jgi:hypothetical protein
VAVGGGCDGLMLGSSGDVFLFSALLRMPSREGFLSMRGSLQGYWGSERVWRTASVNSCAMWRSVIAKFYCVIIKLTPGNSHGYAVRDYDALR